MFQKVKAFLELIKFEHSIFALPFAYLGLFLAEGGWPRLRIFFWVTVAMVAMRTAAMCLNRLIDASIDEANPRTHTRGEILKFLRAHRVWIATLVATGLFF